jgi:hypothetical protein
MCRSVTTSLAFETSLRRSSLIFSTGRTQLVVSSALFLKSSKTTPKLIVPVMPELPPAVEYVAQNQSLFDADEGIYGNFSENEGS